MLKREREAYFPYGVNLYYSVLTTDLSQHTTSGDKSFISKNNVNIESRQSHHVIDMQNALVAASQKVNCLINSKDSFQSLWGSCANFQRSIHYLVSHHLVSWHQPNLVATIQMHSLH